MRTVALLGATGSIGTQTLDVLRAEPEQLRLISAAGGARIDELALIAKEFSLARVGVRDGADAARLRAALGPSTEVVVGPDGLAELAAEADVTVNAVVGFAGLPATLSALTNGRRLALANKESLIAAAPLVEPLRDRGEIVPIDSEHCALHQCLAGSTATGHPDVAALWLTASGGPFRGWSAAQLTEATVEDALAHPTWKMGAKITIDSSTLMNKGLEVLEARALFGVDLGRINVVVHPQSVVHSMVEFVDGSTIAQLARPDMRQPIAYALGLPARLAHGWGQLDWRQALQLTFEPPDRAAFPALDLAYEAGRIGGGAPAWLSAANEEAVAACLDHRLRWRAITDVCREVLSAFSGDPVDSVAALEEHDRTARALARERISRLHP